MRDQWFQTSAKNHYQFCFLAIRIWKEKLPPRIQFFIWLLARDRISSNDALVRRGVLNYNQLACSYCAKVESNIHIVLHCSFAWRFWSLLLNKCNVIWVTPLSLQDFYTQWISLSAGRYRNLWKLFWFFGTWNLWKARNRRVFQDEMEDVHSLVFLSICKAVDFYRVHFHDFPFSGNGVFRCIDFFCNNSYYGHSMIS
ncbi:uncharacterized protein LOC130014976 [Mercurialis annua]|uniref:uncharacterized protein LOC130014976 n=1 Tax=Mercurialis annua TaxID=3986 RepID=UPI0024AF0FC2|nr:uncharacterized protein LOC130014976 [Mercurialis annua]